jgi:hypothetical protein
LEVRNILARDRPSKLTTSSRLELDDNNSQSGQQIYTGVVAKPYGILLDGVYIIPVVRSRGNLNSRGPSFESLFMGIVRSRALPGRSFENSSRFGEESLNMGIREEVDNSLTTLAVTSRVCEG